MSRIDDTIAILEAAGYKKINYPIVKDCHVGYWQKKVYGDNNTVKFFLGVELYDWSKYQAGPASQQQVITFQIYSDTDLGAIDINRSFQIEDLEKTEAGMHEIWKRLGSIHYDS